MNFSIKVLLMTALISLPLTSAMAQDADGWGGDFGDSSSTTGGGGSSDEDALLQSLYNEEEDEDLTRMLQSEDFIFPTSITDGWHFTFHVGAFNSWGSYDSHANWLKRTNLGLALSVGKYLTPINDVRIMVAYGRGTGVRGRDGQYIDPQVEYNNLPWYQQDGSVTPQYTWFETEADKANQSLTSVNFTEPYEPLTGADDVTEESLSNFHRYHWHSLAFSVAWLPNITNLILGYDPERKFTVSALMGIDLEHTWSYSEKHLSVVSVWAEKAKSAAPRNLVGLQVGAQCEFIINPRWHVNFEASETFLDDAYDGLISDQSWDGHLNLLFGVSWFLKGNHTDGRIQNRNPFEDKYLNYTEKIYKNREAIQDALANRPDSVQYVNVTKDVTYTLVAFDEGTIEVPRLQQNNVFQTAETYKRIKDSKIFITNSTRVDDKEFHQRAWSISKLLNQRWQIPFEDIWVDADEAHIQKLQLPDCKHYIIFIVND